MQPQKVLLAVGNKQYSEILSTLFITHPEQFQLSSQEVLHYRYLEEIAELEGPDIIILHDYYLESDVADNESKEKDWLNFVRKMRVHYDDKLRIVFLCERPRGDTFLSSLVNLGVKDIFNDNSIDLEAFLQQLLDEPRFSRVEKFILDGEVTLFEAEPNKNEEKAPSERPVIQKVIEKKVVNKVIEKKVVQKVVNKNVIKRDYRIHVHNSTEKVVGVPIKTKLIMVGSLLPRSGSTFFSHLLVRNLSQIGINTTYVESPFSKAYTYDRLMGERYTQNYRSKFFPYSNEQGYESHYQWNKENVEIICKHPTKEKIYTKEEISFDTFIKVLFSSNSTVTVIDAGKDWHLPIYQDLLDIVDHAYFIIEPDIPFMQYLEESTELSVKYWAKLLELEKCSLIGNRFDKSTLNNKLVSNLFSQKISTYIPAFPTTDVFQSQYDGIFLNDYKDYQKRIEPQMAPLLEEILPHEFLKKQRKGSGILKGLFSKRIVVEKAESKGEKTTL